MTQRSAFALGRAILVGMWGLALATASAPAWASETYGVALSSYYDWHQVSTQHFMILYPKQYEDLALLAARVAEGLWPRIVRMSGVEPRDRTPLILDDHGLSGYSGFAVPQSHRVVLTSFNRGHRVDPTSQLRYLIAHEMGHIANFWGARGPLGDFGELANRFDLPFWFSEGFAEYVASAPSFVFPDRLDLLRSTVLLDHMPSVALLHDPYLGDQPDSLLGYAVGGGLVDYIAAQHGPEAPARIIRRTQMRGPFFEPAIRRAIHQGERDLFTEWLNQLRPRMERLRGMSTDTRTFGQAIRLPYQYTSALRMAPDGRRLAALAYEDYVAGHDLRLDVLDLPIGARELVSLFAHDGFDWSPDGSALVYARDVSTGRGVAQDHVFLWDAMSHRSRQLTSDVEGTDPCFLADGRHVVFVMQRSRWDSALASMSVDGGEPEILYQPAALNEACYSPQPSPDGRFLAFERITDGLTRIALLDLETRTVTTPIPTAGVQRAPEWSPDGEQICFIANPQGTPDLFVWNRNTGAARQLTQEGIGSVRSVTWTPDGQAVIVALAYDRHSEVLRIPLAHELQLHDPAERAAILQGMLPRPAGPDPLAAEAPLANVAILSRGPYHGLRDLELLGPNLEYLSPMGLGGSLTIEDPLREHVGSIAVVQSIPLGALSVRAEYLNTQLRTPLRVSYVRQGYVGSKMTTSVSGLRFDSLVLGEASLVHSRYSTPLDYDRFRGSLGYGHGRLTLPIEDDEEPPSTSVRCAFARVQWERGVDYSDGGEIHFRASLERGLPFASNADMTQWTLGAVYHRRWAEGRAELTASIGAAGGSAAAGGLSHYAVEITPSIDYWQRLSKDVNANSYPYLSVDSLLVHAWYHPKVGRSSVYPTWGATHIAGISLESRFRVLGSLKYRASLGYEWGYGRSAGTARGAFLTLSPEFLF